ncbi:MAG: GDSL-type esterase/lipase family protein [Spirochaetota bacterium]
MRASKFFIVIILSLELVACRTLHKVKVAIGLKQKYFGFNYHDPDFACQRNTISRSERYNQDYLIKWNLIRSEYSKRNKSISKPDAVIVGDSLVHIFHGLGEGQETLRNEFPGIEIHGRGIGGDTTSLLLQRLEKDVLSVQPKTVIIEIGGNDLIFGNCLSAMEENVRKIVELIQAKEPKTRILFLSVPPIASKKLNTITPVYNLFLNSLEKKYKNFYYIEFWTKMREQDKPIIKQELRRPRDKIHFNRNGYKIWGEVLRPYFKQTNKKD